MLSASMPSRSAISTAASRTRCLVSGLRRSALASVAASIFILDILTSYGYLTPYGTPLRRKASEGYHGEETTLTERSVEQATQGRGARPYLPPRWFIRAAWAAH